jgi:hypothetical protein
MNVALSDSIAAPNRIPPPVRSRQWLVWLLLVVVFVSGASIGAAGALLFVRNRVLQLIQHPEAAIPEMAARIGSKLSLSPDQMRRVEQILLARQKSIETIRSEFRPRLLQELDQLEQEVADTLDATQRQKWHALCAHLRRTWLPPAPAH